MRFLKGTLNQSFILTKSNSNITAYSDSDLGGSEENKGKSTSDILIKYNNSPIIWKSKLQTTVAQSTMEAEYYALSETLKEVLWIKQLIEEINKIEYPIKINVDNQSTIEFSNQPNKVFNRTKHIYIQYYFIKNLIENQIVKVNYCPSDENIADTFTKANHLPKFRNLTKRFMSDRGSEKELTAPVCNGLKLPI